MIRHVPGDEQLQRRHMIQVVDGKNMREKRQNKRYYHQSNSIALQLTDLCAHQ